VSIVDDVIMVGSIASKAYLLLYPSTYFYYFNSQVDPEIKFSFYVNNIMIKFTMSYVFHIYITGQFVAVIPEKKIPEKVHAFRQDLCSYTHLNIRVVFKNITYIIIYRRWSLLRLIG
jgi:hypothetical protein